MRSLRVRLRVLVRLEEEEVSSAVCSASKITATGRDLLLKRTPHKPIRRDSACAGNQRTLALGPDYSR